MDEADRAQWFEDKERELAIKAATESSGEEQLIEDGKIVCLDCLKEIPAARLAIAPKACRCVGCQTVMERRSNAQ